MRNYKINWFYISCPSLARLNNFSFVLTPDGAGKDKLFLSREEGEILSKFASIYDLQTDLKFDEELLRLFKLAPASDVPLVGRAALEVHGAREVGLADFSKYEEMSPFIFKVPPRLCRVDPSGPSASTSVVAPTAIVPVSTSMPTPPEEIIQEPVAIVSEPELVTIEEEPCAEGEPPAKKRKMDKGKRSLLLIKKLQLRRSPRLSCTDSLPTLGRMQRNITITSWPAWNQFWVQP